MSDILEKTHADKSRTDGDDKILHYFHRNDISENFMTGKPMVSLCGKILSRQSDPKDRPICQKCKDELEKLQP